MTIPSTFFHLTALGIGGLSPGLKWSRPGGIIDTHLRDRADYRDTHSSVSCRGLCVLFYNLIKYLIAGPGQISWCHVKSQWSPGDKIFIAGLRLSCHINTIQIQSCSSCSIIWIEGTSILWTRGDIQTVNLWNTNSSLFRLELQNKWLLISMYIYTYIFFHFSTIHWNNFKIPSFLWNITDYAGNSTGLKSKGIMLFSHRAEHSLLLHQRFIAKAWIN